MRLTFCSLLDINTAGPSDLVYAQIDLQDKKKTEGKGKRNKLHLNTRIHHISLRLNHFTILNRTDGVNSYNLISIKAHFTEMETHIRDDKKVR